MLCVDADLTVQMSRTLVLVSAHNSIWTAFLTPTQLTILVYCIALGRRIDVMACILLLLMAII